MHKGPILMNYNMWILGGHRHADRQYSWDTPLIIKYMYNRSFIAPLLTVAKYWKWPKCPNTRSWIKYGTNNWILCSFKKLKIDQLGRIMQMKYTVPVTEPHWVSNRVVTILHTLSDWGLTKAPSGSNSFSEWNGNTSRQMKKCSHLDTLGW